MTGTKKKLGEILIAEGLINEYQLAQALGHQKQWKGTSKLGSELIRRGFISEEDLAYALQIQLKIKWLSLHDIHIDYEVVNSVSSDIAKKFMIMPILVDDKSVTLATVDPTDLKMLDTLEFTIGKRINLVISTASDIRWALAKYYDGISSEKAPQKTRHHTEIPLSTGKKETHDNDSKDEIIKSLVMLLVEKGIISKDELAEMLRKMK